MKKVFLLLIFAFIACSPHYSNNPNTKVAIFAKKENKVKTCDHRNKVDCALHLYNASERNISNAKELENKKMFLSATVEYMLAISQLSQAKIHVKQAKEEDFVQFKRVKSLDLENKIEEKIRFCDRKMNILKWKII